MNTEIGIFWCRDCDCQFNGNKNYLNLEVEEGSSEVLNCPYSKNKPLKRMGTKCSTSIAKFSGKLLDKSQKKSLLKKRSKDDFKKEILERKKQMWKDSGISEK
jgi:hypothetical protein